MLSDDPKQVLIAGLASLSANGFRRTGLSWHRDGDGTLFCCGFQRSSLAARYFFNVGVWFESLGGTPPKSALRCHVYGRLETEELGQAIDFEQGAPSNRVEAIDAFATHLLLPIADGARSISGATALYWSGRLTSRMARPESWALLRSGRPTELAAGGVLDMLAPARKDVSPSRGRSHVSGARRSRSREAPMVRANRVHLGSQRRETRRSPLERRVHAIGQLGP